MLSAVGSLPFHLAIWIVGVGLLVGLGISQVVERTSAVTSSRRAGAPIDVGGPVIPADAVGPSDPLLVVVFVPVATLLVFTLLAYSIGAEWWLPAYLVAGSGMVAVSATDLKCGRIPNRIIWPTIVGTTGLLVMASAATGHWRQLGIAVVAALVESAFMLLIRQVRHGMGLGDVRLAGLCGLVAGWLPHGPYLALFGLFIGFVLAAAMAVVKMTARHTGPLTTTLRIGPYLAAGTLIAILWHPALVAA